MSINSQFKKRDNKRGFLLIEVIVSLIMLTSLSMALAVWYSSIINLNYYNYTKIKALSLASSIIEKAKVKNYYKNNSKIDIYNVSIKNTNINNINILTVYVDWQVNSLKKTISLSLGILT